MATTYDKASLVMIPSGVKEDKLYSIKPTDGSGDFTFSRGSDIQATRVNSSGNIEKAKVNLLLQSNTFDTTWSNVLSGSVTGGQSGYDGSSDAWELSKGATAYRYILQNISQSGVSTFSIYAKAGTLNQVTIFNDTGATNPYAKFSLVDGSLVASAGIIDSNATDVGGGWWRLSMTFSATITTARIYPDFAEATAGTIYIQDAQVNHGLVAQDYVETTTTAVVEGLTADLPRLDYSGGASCPSLLLEPSRVNLWVDSEYMGAYAQLTNVSIATNNTTSPEGVQNATKVTADAVSGNHQFQRTNIIFTSGTTYTASCFVKANGYNFAWIKFAGTAGVFDEDYAWFDLSDGTKGVVDGDVTATIEPYGSDWYRITATRSALATGSGKIFFGIGEADNTPTFTGDGTSGVYFYGFQTEAGSYPTSYIPTYSAAANRGADDCEKTGISSLIGQTEGTLFIELDNVDELDVPEITLDDGTNNNRIVLTRSFTGYWSLFTASAGSGSSTSSAVISNNGKFAIAYNATNYVVYKDGALLLTRTASLPASLTDFRLNGRVTDDFYGNKSIKQALVFKTRLTDAELAALTA